MPVSSMDYDCEHCGKSVTVDVDTVMEDFDLHTYESARDAALRDVLKALTEAFRLIPRDALEAVQLELAAQHPAAAQAIQDHLLSRPA